MKSKFKNGYAVALLCLVAFGCQEQDNDPNPNYHNIPSFKSQEELTKSLEMVLSLNSEELKSFEESRNYLSFGYYANELESKASEIQNTNDFYSFVNQNENFLEVGLDDLGELALSVKYENQPLRYLMNVDRIFNVGNRYYKVFENGIASSDLCCLQELMSKETYDVEHIEGEKMSDSRILDLANNCGSSKSSSKTSGDNRMRFTIKTEVRTGPLGYDVGMYFHLKNQRKNGFGIWVSAERTTSAEIAAYVDYRVKSESVWFRSFQNFGITDDKIKDWEGFSSVDLFVYDMDHHFGDYKFWYENSQVSRTTESCASSTLIP